MLRSTWVTQSGHVIEGPARLSVVALTSTAAGAAAATLHAGRDDAGQVLLVIRALANYTDEVFFATGVPIPDGLYVALGSNVEGILILYDDSPRVAD